MSPPTTRRPTTTRRPFCLPRWCTSSHQVVIKEHAVQKAFAPVLQRMTPFCKGASYEGISKADEGDKDGVIRQGEDTAELAERRGIPLQGSRFRDNDKSATHGTHRPQYELLMAAVGARSSRTMPHRNQTLRASYSSATRVTRGGQVVADSPDVSRPDS